MKNVDSTGCFPPGSSSFLLALGKGRTCCGGGENGQVCRNSEGGANTISDRLEWGCDRERGAEDFSPSTRKDGVPFSAMERLWEQRAFPVSAPHPPSSFALSVQTSVQAGSSSRPEEEGSSCLPAHSRGRQRNGGEGCGAGPQLTAMAEILAWGMARPAPGKSLLLSVKAGPEGKTQTETPTGDESFSPVVFGVRESLWPQLRLNKSTHNTSSPTTCLAKERKLSL